MGLRTNLFLVILLVTSLVIGIAGAEDFTVTDQGVSASVWPGEIHYTATSDNGTDELVMTTDVNNAEIIGSPAMKNQHTVQYQEMVPGSGYCVASYCFYQQTDYTENVTYNPNDKSLEQTFVLNTPHTIEYNVELNAGQTIELQDDGSINIVQDGGKDPSVPYIQMSKPVGVDASGQAITNISFGLSDNVISVNVPDQGDDGQDLQYPIVIDPVLSRQYFLVLLVHANYEPPTYAQPAPTDVRDSSPYFAVGQLNSTLGAITNINNTFLKYGNASLFSKNNGTATFFDAAQYAFGLNNFSVSAWFYQPGPNTGTFYPLEQTQTLNNENLFFWASPTLTFKAVRGGGNILICQATPAVTQNAWHQVAFIENGTTGQLYFDGVASGSPCTRSGSLTRLTGTQLNLGEATSGQVIHHDEIQIFNGGPGLNIQDLQGEYPLYLNASTGAPNLGYADDNYTVSLLHFDGGNGGTFFKDEVGNRTWTAGGSLAQTQTSQYKFSPSSGYFNGTGYVTTPYTSSFDFESNDFTIDAWVYPSYPSDGTYQGIFGTLSSGSAGANGYELATSNSGSISLYSNASGSIVAYAATPPGSLPYNQWSHIAVVRSGNALRTYINGQNLGSTDVTGLKFNSSGHIGQIGGAFTDLPGVWTYHGYIDELRVTNGLARWTGNFVPPTTPYGITAPSTPGATPSGSGTIPATIQFTDNTPDSAWTSNGFYWQFGDGTVSNLQNPSHTYSSAGLYTVTENVLNNNMTATAQVGMNIGAPYVDFLGSPRTGTAAMWVNFTDLTTNITPVTIYNMSFGDGTYSALPGPWQHVYSSFGTYNVNLTETNSIGTGYNYKANYIVTSTNQNQQQTFYTPHQVHIKFVDGMNDPLPGTQVYVFYNSTTMPNGNTSWLTAAYGIPLSVANDMVNSNLAMTGIAATDGYITFTMFGSINYQIMASNNGIAVTNYTTSLYPIDNEYILRIQNNPYQIAAQNASLVKVVANLNTTVPNITFLRMNLFYQDTQGYTTDVKHYVWDGTNGTIYESADLGNPGTASLADYFDLPNIRGYQYMQNYTATRVTP